MSTRTYTLTFATAGEQVLPQGRFFMIKAASAALSIEARKRNGQPVVFEGVGAGLAFNGLESDRWYEMVVRSSGAQTVEIVISDDSQVTFAQAVNILGAPSFVELPSTAVSTPALVAVANGTAQNVAANPARRRITFCNASTNAGSVFIQAPGAGAGRGIELQPGMCLEFKTTAALAIRNDSGGALNIGYMEET